MSCGNLNFSRQEEIGKMRFTSDPNFICDWSQPMHSHFYRASIAVTGTRVARSEKSLIFVSFNERSVSGAYYIRDDTSLFVYDRTPVFVLVHYYNIFHFNPYLSQLMPAVKSRQPTQTPPPILIPRLLTLSLRRSTFSS